MAGLIVFKSLADALRAGYQVDRWLGHGLGNLQVVFRYYSNVNAAGNRPAAFFFQEPETQLR
jgi:hypothetical protein